MTPSIDNLFTPDFTETLNTAPAEDHTKLLHDEISRAFDAQPEFCKQFAETTRNTPLNDTQLRQMTELVDGKLPLNDGSTIPLEDPFPWYNAGRGDKIGGNGSAIISQRIAFASPMLRAWRQTGHDSFAEYMHDLTLDYFNRYWTDSQTLPSGEGWTDNWLCTSCRCGAWNTDKWGGVYAVLSDPDMRQRFSFDELVTIFNGINNMLTGLIPELALGSNWRIYELLNIFTAGLSYPFLKNSAYWLELSVASLNEEFYIQFHDDGSHEELCYHYGIGSWATFTDLYVLQKQAPELGFDFDQNKMEACCDYWVGCHKPFGLQAMWGDEYSPRTPEQQSPDMPPVKNHDPKTWDYMIINAVRGLNKVDDIASARHIDGGPAPEWTSQFHKDSGYMVMRDGWDNESLYANLNMGYYDGCHTHYSLLSLEVAALGREFIVDPGVGGLNGLPQNQNFQRTRAHSTMTVDDLDQNIRAKAEVSRIYLGDEYDFTVGVFRGGWTIDNPYGAGCTSAGRYTQAFSGDHFRHLLFVKNGYWVLFDALTTHAKHEAQTRFQFLPNAMTELPGGGYATGYDEHNLAMIPLQWDGWTHEIRQGELDPVDGWVPGGGGQFEPAPLITGRTSTAPAPCWHGTLLFPYREKELPQIDVTPMDSSGAGFAYRITTTEWTDYIFMSNSWYPRPIVMDDVETNAVCLHLRIIDGKPARGFACEGTYLQAGNLELFNAPGTMLAREFEISPDGDVTTQTKNPRKPE